MDGNDTDMVREKAARVISFSTDDPLEGFAGMWYRVFLSALFSSIFVHLIAAAVAFGRLRRHKIGRFIPLLLLVVGVVSPLVCGSITSVAIAGMYRACGFQMAPLYAVVWGVGQTLGAVFISFTRILATL